VASAFPGRGAVRRHGPRSFFWRAESQSDIAAVAVQLLALPFAEPKRSRARLLLNGFYELREAQAYRPTSPAYPRWCAWLLEWAATWGGPEDQRRQLGRFLPEVEVERLMAKISSGD